MEISTINFNIREMKIEDYPQLIALWKSVTGLKIDEEDSYENMITFLSRNIGLSFVATEEDKIVGTIKGAQDGRRGYISHMAIIPEYQKLGIAKALLNKTIQGLKDQGIHKCNLYVQNFNANAIEFWHHNGWRELDNNFKMMQKII